MAAAPPAVNKIISDIKECVTELRKEYQECRIPVNDDCTILHRFNAKLEYVLQHGKKEKRSLLGARKDYWNYFCHCLASNRKAHDGLRYVKTISELKTPLGCGRAFIRFCLMHQCLADTLQQCFMNEKITSDWYYERALIRQPEQRLYLLTTLYDLNDIQFDLCPRGHDLDVSWPTFSRKLFGASYSWQPPSRSVSISSLISVASQSDVLTTPRLHSDSQGWDFPVVEEGQDFHVEENIQCELTQMEENQDIESSLMKEQQVGNTDGSEKFEVRFPYLGTSQDNSVNEAVDTNSSSEMVKENVQKFNVGKWTDWEQYSEREQELMLRISQLEVERNGLAEKLSLLESNLSKSEDIYDISELGEDHITDLQNKDKMHSEIQNECTRSQAEQEMINRITELMARLSDTEASFLQVSTDKAELSSRLDHLQCVNDSVKILVEAVEQENSKLRRDNELLRNAASNQNQQLEDVQKINISLQSKISELENKPTRSLDTVVEEIEVDGCSHSNSSVTEVPLVEEDQLAMLREVNLLMNDFECDLERSVDKTDSTLHDTFLTLKEKLKILQGSMYQKTHKLIQNENVELLQQQEESSGLQAVLNQEKTLVDELNQKLEVLLQQNHSLNSQLCLLREILYPQQRIPSGDKSKHKSRKRAKSPRIEEDVARDSGNESSSAPSSSRGRESVDSSEESVAFNVSNLSCSTTTSVVSYVKCISNKLQNLIGKVDTISLELGSSCDLNSNLISRVQEQVRKLTGITQELENSQNLLSGLKKEHNKLKTAESIMKYELQEKRKLLTRLRKQLESTREDWNRVRLKNSESEAEWQNLREEFAKRHKQASEESGFVDDAKASDDHNSDNKERVSVAAGDVDQLEQALPENECTVLSTSPCKGAEGGSDEVEIPQQQQKSRLEILEEQCHLFYISLLQNAKKSTLLEERLQAVLSGSSRFSSSSDMLGGEGGSKGGHSRSGQDLENTDSLADGTLHQDEEYESDITHDETDASGYSELDMSPFTKVNVSFAEAENQLSAPSLQDEPDLDLLQSNLELTDINSNVKENLLDTRSTVSTPDCLEGHQSESNDSDSESTPSMAQLREDDFMQLSMRRKLLGNVVERLKNERITHKHYESELKSQVEELQRTKSDLEQQLATVQCEKSGMSNKEIDFKKRAEFIFRKEREQFTNKLSESHNRNSELEAKVIELEQELKDALQQIVMVQNELRQVMKELDLVKAAKDQETAALQFQLSSEALKYERALRQYSEQDADIADMRKRVTDQEMLIHSLEEALEEIKGEREEEKNHQWRELEEIQVALSIRDEECAALNEDVKKAVMELDEEKKAVVALYAQLEETKSCNEEIISEKNAELSQLRSDVKELTKKLIRLIKEKDILWKRTDHLSHLQRVQAADRWMDDSEVDRCLGCKVQFSFTFRKHHCRLCGRIFCRDCANNWLLTTASSRQSRVCNECFIQHAQFESEAGSSNSVPTVMEDSEDEDISENSDLSFTRHVEAVSSISVSNKIGVASLPTPPVRPVSTTTPIQCGSAPELNCAGFNSSIDDTSLHTGEQAFLSASDDLVAVSRNSASQYDFDVISDEEIARSLSASSPYSPFCEIKQPESRLLLTITRTAEELEETGAEGEMWVNAGMKYGVPVHCHMNSATLKWKFSSEPKSISFGIEYQKNEKSSLEMIWPSVRVKSHIQCIEGKLLLKKPGVYILVFDNTFSRVMAKKIRYFLQIYKSSTDNT